MESGRYRRNRGCISDKVKDEKRRGLTDCWSELQAWQTEWLRLIK